PIAAPSATGPLAMAWNHLQVSLIDRLGDDGLALARPLRMTTSRSEADFDGRFGRDVEPDGRSSIVSYLDHQGRKLIDRFDGETYRVLAGAMDRHDIGAARGGVLPALASLEAAGTRLTGIGIEDDILYWAAQVRRLGGAPSSGGGGGGLAGGAAGSVGGEAAYREIRSTKGHDAFVVEWEQLTDLLGEALAAD